MAHFNEALVAELDKPLDPKRVSRLRRGNLAYLEGHDVIRRANELFGYGGWGFEITVKPHVLEEGSWGNAQNPTAYQVWSCCVRLTISGCPTVEEIGTNVRSGDGPDGLEMAYKGTLTDALKRCFHHYGDQFGLSLYDKDAPVDAPQTAQNRPAATRAPKPDAPLPSMDAEPEEPDWWRIFQVQMRNNNITFPDLDRYLKQEGPATIERVRAYGKKHNISQIDLIQAVADSMEEERS